MYHNKNSFISASQCVFLRRLVFKKEYPQDRVLRGCGYVKNLSELRKEEAQETKNKHYKLYRQGLPTSARRRGFRPRHRSHVDNPREGDVYNRLSGRADSYKFYLLT